MKTSSVLFILTSHSLIGDTGKPTGVWLEELSTPYYEFVNAGYKIEIASISGGAAPIDPGSQKEIGTNPPSVERFLKDKDAMKKINNTDSIDKIDASDYAVIFLPGGHGTMWDLPTSKSLAKIVSTALTEGRIVAAVCHGPVGLVNATFADGSPVVKDRKISVFTDSEEKAMGLEKTVPFLLETRLRELGADIQKAAPNFEPMAVADNNLITGQNPASSKKVADLVIEALK